jgi:hypothetical protein
VHEPQEFPKLSTSCAAVNENSVTCIRYHLLDGKLEDFFAVVLPKV